MHELDVQWLMTPETPSVDELLARIVNRPAWHALASCRGMGTDLFFPTTGESAEPARVVCDGCSVRSECISAALAESWTKGVWGGLSERGRRVLRRAVA